MKNKIFALDVGDRKLALKYCEKLVKRAKIANDIFAIKVGLIDIIDDGLSILRDIKKKTKLPIICDLKLSEIPTIAVNVAKKVAKAGADGIVVQGFVGKKIVDAIQEGVPELDIYLVSEMTHNEGGFTQTHLREIAAIANNKKLTGIIGPANRPERLMIIKDIVSTNCKVIATGISKGKIGNEIEAFANGADLIIQGTAIRDSLDMNKDGINFLFKSVGIYALVGTLLGVFLIYLNNTKLYLIADRPIINVAIPTIFAITGSVVGYFKGKI